MVITFYNQHYLPANTILLSIISLLTALTPSASVYAQNNQQNSSIIRIQIPISNNRYYIVRYRDTKPDDVPQEIYDRLFEIQMEVVNNFTYDYAVLNRRKKHQYMYTKEDFYKYGMGVCENYSNFFIILAREKGLTENLYKVSGNGRGGGHAWLEYRTENNVYIIDPTWSDDFAYTGGNAKELFRESPAYGKHAFFITYPESRIIFGSSRNHNSYTTGKTETALWNIDEITGNEQISYEDM